MNSSPLRTVKYKYLTHLLELIQEIKLRTRLDYLGKKISGLNIFFIGWY